MCRYKIGLFLLVILGMLGNSVCAKAEDKKAISPSPKDGATDVSRDVGTLTWLPGQTTPKYDVYIGTVKKYVERVDRSNPVYVVASLGQTDKKISVPRLELGAPYYWRVDEVNDAKPDAVKVIKGDVWSFMVEVPALPVANVTATASGSSDGGKPAKTVDGSGLSAGKHSTEASDMWLSSVALPQPKDPKDPNGPKVTPETWIQFKLPKVQRLYQMTVWNWNAKDTLEYGMKEITVQYSTNGTDWKAVGDFSLAKGTGTKEYAGCELYFTGVTATHIKIIAKSGYGTSGQYGLSEVSFTAEPVYARDPSPASGAKNVALDATLNWRVGREAVSHKVYVSTDKAAVEKGTVAAIEVKNANSLKLSSLDVALGKTYYWRVDEVNDKATPKSFAGDIWSFSAVDYLVVDDFEASAWADRWAKEGDVSPALTKDNVHGGKQAFALGYNESNFVGEGLVTLSKVSPKNWTKSGIKTLLISVLGDPKNKGGVTLSLRINNTDLGLNYKAGVKQSWWDTWAIDLAALQSKVGDVSSIALRLYMGSGSKGTVYVDDIRLSAQTTFTPSILSKLAELNAAEHTKGQFDLLWTAIFAADKSVIGLLTGDTAYTLFAPTDDAFTAAGFSADSIGKMDQAVLTSIMKYHLAKGAIPPTAKKEVSTEEGSTLLLDHHILTDDVGGQAVILASTDEGDLSNGVIHTVNGVVMPFDLRKIVDLLKAMNGAGTTKGQFDTLVAAIEAAKPAVRDTLNKTTCTLFAPTDDAFKALGYDDKSIKKEDPDLVTDLLLYHIVSGRLLEKDLTATLKTVQGAELKQSKGVLKDVLGGEAKITGFDVEAANGIIDVVDAVLKPYTIPPVPLFALVRSLNKDGIKDNLDKGEFDTLLAILDAADADVLKQKMGAGSNTLFAPTDAAFKAFGLDPNAVKALVADCKTAPEIVKDAKAYLARVVLYHMASGKLATEDLWKTEHFKSLQNEVLIPDSSGGLLVTVYADAAKILVPDLGAYKGVVHVIDATLLPPSAVYVRPECPLKDNLLETVKALNKDGDHKGQFDTFLALVSAVDKTVADALTGKADNTLFLPTEEAFDKLDPKIDSLNKVVIADILKYHITAGKLMMADVKAKITMLKGGDVQQKDGVLTDNTGGKAKVKEQDLKARNGVIHVIDAVLLPATTIAEGGSACVLP